MEGAPPASAHHTDYIGYWLKVLRDDGRIISRATDPMACRLYDKGALGCAEVIMNPLLF